MDRPLFHPSHDRIARRMTEGAWTEPARTFEEALEYALYRANLLGVKQILRQQSRMPGLPTRWMSQSVRSR